MRSFLDLGSERKILHNPVLQKAETCSTIVRISASHFSVQPSSAKEAACQPAKDSESNVRFRLRSDYLYLRRVYSALLAWLFRYNIEKRRNGLIR
jgi:hypothetical protein